MQNICIGIHILVNLLHLLPYCYRRTTDNRRICIERPDAVASRARFLREIRKYRKAGYSVVYVDETWVNQNHCTQYTWLPNPKLLGIWASKEMLKLPNIPSGKGKRLIILHAGSGDKSCQVVSLHTLHHSGDGYIFFTRCMLAFTVNRPVVFANILVVALPFFFSWQLNYFILLVNQNRRDKLINYN